MSVFKNLPLNQKFALKKQIDYRSGQVLSQCFLKSDIVEGGLYAFDQGEGISEQIAMDEILLIVLEGVMKIGLDKKESDLKEGEAVLITSGSYYEITGITPIKLVLVSS